MVRAAIPVVALALVLAVPAVSPAQPEDEPPSEEAPPEEAPAPEDDPPPTTPQPRADPRIDELADAVEELREENEDLRDEVEILREDVEYTDERVTSLLPVKGRISGYLDFGAFWVGGEGRGIREDDTRTYFPEYDADDPSGPFVPGQWVFMGDPLSVMINSRGDPADVSESRAITYDQIGTGGAAGFLVNTFNLQLFTGIGETLTLTSFIDFVPRGRDMSNPDGLAFGDFVDVKLAYLEWLTPLASIDLRVQAGKFDSVLGYEYRVQEAPDRLTVTPSLICRYLCGHPLGVKARARFLDRRLIVNVALTNGSHFTEGFNFADEQDSNDPPTAAARVSYAPPLGKTFEIGVSGAIGAQDTQPDPDVLQWHVGVDARLLIGDLEVYAEFVKGEADGVTPAGGDVCEAAACLEYMGAYGLFAYRATNQLVPYARVDWRDALHLLSGSFVYISELWRVTAGLRVEIGSHVIIKGEYIVNRELGRLPQFDNDLFTSSMIVKY